MKVIEDKTLKRIVCPHCGSILEVSRVDVKEFISFKNITYPHGVKCPCCNRAFQTDEEGNV